MMEGGIDASFFIVGDGPKSNVYVTTERMLAQIDAYPEDLMLVRSSKDVEQAHETGKIGIIMSIEGAGRWLGGEADILHILYRLGIRSVGITHGEGGDEAVYLQGSKSPFGFCTAKDREQERKEGSGLTAFGREILRLSNEIGIVTDLAHINDKAFYEAIELSTLPLTMTHTAVFSLSPHWRCLTDDQIKALAETGGVMGITFAPNFIHPENPTIDRLVEHICYVADLVGIEYVAIGTDFDGLGSSIPVVPEASQLVNLTRSMMAHGLSEGEIQKVWGGNFLRLLQQTIDHEPLAT
jgi:membrane dipeptidase